MLISSLSRRHLRRLLRGTSNRSYSPGSAAAAAGILNSSRPSAAGMCVAERQDGNSAAYMPLARNSDTPSWDLWQGQGIFQEKRQGTYAQHQIFDKRKKDIRVVKLRQLPTPKLNNKVMMIGGSRMDQIIKTCEDGHLAEAVQALALLVAQASLVPYSLFYTVLKRCTAQKDLALGRRVHGLTRDMGYQTNAFLATHIIRMYASHGELGEALQAFNAVTAPDTFVWNSVISAYADNRQPCQAIELYKRMRRQCTTAAAAVVVEPNNYVFVAVLKACADAADHEFGKRVHADVLAAAEEPDAFVGSCLVDMYAKCGRLGDARRAFDALPVKNVVTWTAMVSGYVDHGLEQQALGLYGLMLEQGPAPDKHVLACLLKACAGPGDLHRGRQIHGQVEQLGVEGDPVVSSKLILMYAKCGCVEDARRVFDKRVLHDTPSRGDDVMPWNAMLTGYLEHGLHQEGTLLYLKMQEQGILPNRTTFACLLQACSSIGALHLGKELHARIQKQGLLEGDVVIGNCLVNMYAKNKSLEDARSVFDRMPVRDAVTWSAMLTGYAQHGQGQEALNLYAANMEVEEQHHGGCTSTDCLCDGFTFACLLKACAQEKSLLQGKQLHAQIQEKGLEMDVVVGTALIDMYVKCGSLEEARRVFDNLPAKNVVTWNAMMAGCVRHELYQEALGLYKSMQEEGVTQANCGTFVCLLQACASTAALHQGKQLHSQITRRGLETELMVGTSLVDMYAKCGSLDEARRVFDRLGERSVVTWNALLNGYAHHSNSHMAIQCFEEMQQQGVEPDDATFISLLVACSHGSLVKEGRLYFRMMQDLGVVPNVAHYNCMVDLLGRSGQLHDAKSLLDAMPLQKDAVGWTSLLNACKMHGDVELARCCFDNLVELEPDSAVAYALLGSIYANAGRSEDVHGIENLRRSAGAWKKPAKACIEVKSKVHEFIVGEERADISLKLKSTNLWLKEGGHVPHTELVLKRGSESQKEDALCGHAEKLALAYGLINTPGGTTLLVTKNLRMCNDCHSGTKVMSRLEKREIIVKDAHRVHHFVDGACSCGDGL